MINCAPNKEFPLSWFRLEWVSVSSLVGKCRKKNPSPHLFNPTSFRFGATTFEMKAHHCTLWGKSCNCCWIEKAWFWRQSGNSSFIYSPCQLRLLTPFLQCWGLAVWRRVEKLISIPRTPGTRGHGVGFVRGDWNVKFNQRKFKSWGSDAIVSRKLLAKGDEFRAGEVVFIYALFYTDPRHPSPAEGAHINHPTDFMCGVMLIFTLRATNHPVFWWGGGEY